MVRPFPRGLLHGVASPGGLWTMLVLCGIVAAVAAVPIAPADFWWHLKAGETLLDGGGLLTADPYSFTAAGRPFVHQAWLAGAAFAAALRLGGLEWLAVGNALLFAAGYGLVLLRCRDHAGGRVAALATALGFAVSVENWTLRPQTFSVVLLPLVLLIVGRYTEGRLPARGLLVLPLVTALWANLHGLFVLGILIPIIAATGLALEGRMARPSTEEQGRPMGASDVGALPLVAAAVASAAAACLTPWGVGIYGYVWTVSTSPVMRRFVLEWAPTDFSFLPGRVLAGLVLILLVAAVAARRRPRLWELLLLLVVLAMALSAVRSVIWFGMVAAPVLADLIPRLPLLQERGSAVVLPSPSPLLWTASGKGGVEEGEPGRIGLAILLLILLMPLVTTPWVRARLPLPPERRAVITPDTPVAAAQALAALPPGRRTFHDMQYGSYLVWATAPRQPVFIDPRMELYTFEEWNDYGTMAAGLDVAALLARYRLDTLLLDRRRQAAFIAVLAADPAWAPVYADQTAVLYRRKEAIP